MCFSNEHERSDRISPLAGRIEKEKFSKTLRWEPHASQAYTSGGVAYRSQDGALQINETGLYHIYSRVELIFKDCSTTSFFVHTVFVRRIGRPLNLTLMEAHRAGSCSQQPGYSWTTESYLGSALQLQKHDRVFVNVSHPSFLTHAHYANFFGLYKIWSIGGDVVFFDYCSFTPMKECKMLRMSQAGVDLTHHFTRMIPMLNWQTYYNWTEKHNMKWSVLLKARENDMHSLYWQF